MVRATGVGFSELGAVEAGEVEDEPVLEIG